MFELLFGTRRLVPELGPVGVDCRERTLEKWGNFRAVVDAELEGGEDTELGRKTLPGRVFVKAGVFPEQGVDILDEVRENAEEGLVKEPVEFFDDIYNMVTRLES